MILPHAFETLQEACVLRLVCHRFNEFMELPHFWLPFMRRLKRARLKWVEHMLPRMIFSLSWMKEDVPHGSCPPRMKVWDFVRGLCTVNRGLAVAGLPFTFASDEPGSVLFAHDLYVEPHAAYAERWAAWLGSDDAFELVWARTGQWVRGFATLDVASATWTLLPGSSLSVELSPEICWKGRVREDNTEHEAHAIGTLMRTGCPSVECSVTFQDGTFEGDWEFNAQNDNPTDAWVWNRDFDISVSLSRPCMRGPDHTDDEYFVLNYLQSF